MICDFCGTAYNVAKQLHKGGTRTHPIYAFGYAAIHRPLKFDKLLHIACGQRIAERMADNRIASQRATTVSHQQQQRQLSAALTLTLYYQLNEHNYDLNYGRPAAAGVFLPPARRLPVVVLCVSRVQLTNRRRRRRAATRSRTPNSVLVRPCAAAPASPAPDAPI